MISFSLWDTAGQEGYDQLRILAYNSCDVVIACFSVDKVQSLSNIENVWIPGKLWRLWMWHVFNYFQHFRGERAL